MATPVRQAPGGTSTICLGMDCSDVTAAKVSANAFARGSDQNCGNFITDRPTTCLHAPPGGKSSICLGTDSEEWTRTSGAYIRSQPAAAVAQEAQADASQPGAAGTSTAVMSAAATAAATEGVHARTPGGKSTICLGTHSEEWKRTSSAYSNAQTALVQEATAQDEHGTAATGASAATEGVHARTPGGKATICLGTDAEEWKRTSSAYSNAQTALLQEAGGVDCVRHPAEDEQSAASRTPAPAEGVFARTPGGKATICLGTDNEEWQRTSSAYNKTQATLAQDEQNAAASGTSAAAEGVHAPPGGKATICLGTDAEEWKRTSSAYSHTPTPVARDTSGVDCGQSVVVTRAPAAAEGTHAPPGGKTTICLGTDAEEWKRTSSAFSPSSTWVLNSQSVERAPPGGKATIILGAAPEEFQKLEERLVKPADEAKEDVQMEVAEEEPKQDQEEEEEEEEKEQEEPVVPMESPTKKPKVLEQPSSDVKSVTSEMFMEPAGRRCLNFDDQLPTPVRASCRAPPGGKATVLLG